MDSRACSRLPLTCTRLSTTLTRPNSPTRVGYPSSSSSPLSFSFSRSIFRLVLPDCILSLYQPCSFSLLLRSRLFHLSLSPWYALRFAARGDAPLPFRGFPHRSPLAGLEIPTTQLEQLIREGGQPPLIPPRFGRILAAPCDSSIREQPG